MNRLVEADLNQICANYAGKYVVERFKTGSDADRSLVLNTLAHGHYMGARYAEKVHSRGWAVLFFQTPPFNDKFVGDHAQRAAKTYLEKTGYDKLDLGKSSLAKAMLCMGFEDGFRAREQLA